MTRAQSVRANLDYLVPHAFRPMDNGFDMINVTRLNQTEMIINAEKIEFIEATPDTIITLSSGKKVMVAESVDRVVDLVIDYKRKSHQPLLSTIG
jgi:flagellar protein FlbD